jgi:hypothetical protein
VDHEALGWAVPVGVVRDLRVRGQGRVSASRAQQCAQAGRSLSMPCSAPPRALTSDGGAATHRTSNPWAHLELP